MSQWLVCPIEKSEIAKSVLRHGLDILAAFASWDSGHFLLEVRNLLTVMEGHKRASNIAWRWEDGKSAYGAQPCSSSRSEKEVNTNPATHCNLQLNAALWVQYALPVTDLLRNTLSRCLTTNSCSTLKCQILSVVAACYAILQKQNSMDNKVGSNASQNSSKKKRKIILNTSQVINNN